MSKKERNAVPPVATVSYDGDGLSEVRHNTSLKVQF